MALDSYANLQTAVANWLQRTDLSAIIPDAITLAEVQFNRTIRHRAMELRAVATAAEYIDLPNDYLELRRIWLNTSPKTELRLLYEDEPAAKYSNTGKPVGYLIIADQFQLAPPPDTTYEVEIDYWSVIPSLSNVATTNWLLQTYPDIYLLGTILAMTMHIQNDPRMPMVQAQFTALLDDINRNDRKQRFSGTAPYMRAA